MRFAMNEWKNDLLTSGTRRAMPLVLLPGVAHLGKTVRDAVYTPEVQADAAMFLAEKYPTPAAIMMMDLSLEAEAFGAKVTIPEHDVPTVTEPCVNDAESVQALCVPSLETTRIPVYLKATELMVRNYSAKPTLASCIGPLSLSARLIEITELMTSMMLEPEKTETLLEKATQFLLSYAAEYKKIGANGILIAEPVAGLLSPELCEQFSSRYVRRIVDALQDETFLVFLHNCGQSIPLLPSMQGTGASGLSLGNAIDIAEAVPQVAPTTIVLGNLDPVSVLQRSSAEDVRRAASERLAKTAPYAHHILSSGCDMPYSTPLANIDAMFNAVDEFNAAR